MTSLENSDFFSSGEAAGGMGGLTLTLLGDASLGGRLGGFSWLGELTDLTVLTEAVEDMESELEVMLIFEGLMGDLLRSRSSDDELSLPLTLALAWVLGAGALG